MKNYLIILLFLCGYGINAQKQTTEIIDAGAIERLVLQSDEIYRVTVASAPVEDISITSKAEGEYYNNISLDTEVRGKDLYLNSRFREILQGGFDKLSAHKVFAMEVTLIIPEGMKLEIISNVASVYLSGYYDHVLVQLKGGSGYLMDFTGDAVINTFNGNIDVTTTGATIDATTRHGTLEVASITPGMHSISLSSINGNIKVQETK